MKNKMKRFLTDNEDMTHYGLRPYYAAFNTRLKILSPSYRQRLCSLLSHSAECGPFSIHESGASL